MSQAVSLGRLCGPRTRGALISTLAALAIIGCGGGGGGGGSGIPLEDDHGDTPLTATVVIPDGANIKGYLNFDTDQDWFRFRGIQGVSYVLQIEGFPPDPNVNPFFDLTGDGAFLLQVAIRDVTGETTGSTISNFDEDPYTTLPLGVEDPGEGFLVLGDSRIHFMPTHTGDYFIRLIHQRPFQGTGSYEIRLATSDLTLILPGEIIQQTGVRNVFLVDDQGMIEFAGPIGGFVAPEAYIWLLGGGGDEFTVTPLVTALEFAVTNVIFLPMSDEPENLLIHLHPGSPNNFIPQFSDDPGEGPIAIEIDLSTLFDERRLTTTTQITEAHFRLEDGTEARVPATVEFGPKTMRDGSTGYGGRIELDYDSAISSDTRGVFFFVFGSVSFPVSLEALRTITGFDWFLDIHPQTDMDRDPSPIATSRPRGDMYSMFETALFTSPINIPDGTGATSSDDERGVIQDFQIFYDSSLKLFQVATQYYEALIPTTLNPDYTPYVGQRVRVHQGGPGQNGPVLFDVGTLPALTPPPTASPPFFFTEVEPPGIRAPIRQITDAEAVLLRDAFYGPGFYVLVTDAQTGAPLARAEGFLEISEFPTLEPCDLQPCFDLRGVDHVEKAVVNFATTVTSAGNITVIFNGQTLGVLNKAVSKDDLPACGLAGDGSSLAAEEWPEVYYWRAFAEDGTTWDGHVTLNNGACETVLLE